MSLLFTVHDLTSRRSYQGLSRRELKELDVMLPRGLFVDVHGPGSGCSLMILLKGTMYTSDLTLPRAVTPNDLPSTRGKG